MRSCKDVNLIGADLSFADISDSDLSNANLSGADLSDADFQKAKKLKPSQIKAARKWEDAFYSEEMLEHLGLPPDHNEKLQKES